MSAFQGFFELRTARDLRDKLHRDFDRLQATPLDVDAAFNFFVTAEHLLDWIHPKRAGDRQRKAERDGSVLLQVCSHLANGAKHFEVEDSRHNAANETTHYFTPALGGRWRFGPISPFIRKHLLVRLSGTAAMSLGPAVTVLDLAQQVLEFWDSHPGVT